MAQLFLPDNTVLINFAIIGAMELLAELLNGQGRWCISIARECQNSRNYYPDIAAANTIFGAPLVPNSAEYVDTRTLRDTIAVPGDPAVKHLGEAETIAIISRRRLDAYFLTDDGDATTLAAQHGIQVVTTWDLLRLAHKTGKVTKPVLITYVDTLMTQQRGRPPGVVDPTQLDGWL